MHKRPRWAGSFVGLWAASARRIDANIKTGIHMGKFPLKCGNRKFGQEITQTAPVPEFAGFS